MLYRIQLLGFNTIRLPFSFQACAHALPATRLCLHEWLCQTL